MTRAPRWTLAGGLALVLLTWVGGLWTRLDYDEGVYSQTLRLVSSGRPLVSDVFTSQPPLWPYLALPGWLAGGITGGRLWIMMFGLLGLYAVWRIGRVYTSPRLAALAAILVAASPEYSSTAAALQADIPALALAMCALVPTLAPRLPDERRQLARTCAAGALFGLALMVKLLVAPMVVVPIVAALLTNSRRRAAAEIGGFVASAAVVMVAIGAGFWHGGELWTEAVGLHVRSQSFVGGLKANVSTALNAPGTCAFLLVGACAAAEIIRHRDRERTLLVAWFAGTGLFLLVHVPLFTHHLVLAVPPAALLIVLELSRVLQRKRLDLAVVGLIALCLVGSAADRLTSPARETIENNPAAQALHRLPADAVVVTDDQVLATAADRSVAGPLVDTSQVRIAAGNLTPVQVCAQIAGADAVLLTRDGRFSALPGVTSCTRATMKPVWSDANAVLFVRSGISLAPAGAETQTAAPSHK